jgi:hypothetical protein
MNQRSFWGEPDDDELLPDWMDPVKCRQLNEQRKQRRQNGKDLNSVIQECLKQPAIPVIIETPKI